LPFSFIKKRIAMDTNEQNREAGSASEGENSLQNFNKEDMLDLAKGAAAMDNLDIEREKIDGRTVGGAGAGTGDTGGDFDRPGTEGLPAINDYVEPEGLAEPSAESDADKGSAAEDFSVVNRDQLSADIVLEGEEASGYPGGGAVRTAEDRLPKGETDENTGFSPESPMNK
jgi:hypothetical protein